MPRPWTPPAERLVILHRETCQEHEDADHWIDENGDCHGDWTAIRACYRYIKHMGFQRYQYAIPTAPADEIAIPAWMEEFCSPTANELTTDTERF